MESTQIQNGLSNLILLSAQYLKLEITKSANRFYISDKDTVKLLVMFGFTGIIEIILGTFFNISLNTIIEEFMYVLFEIMS